MKKIFIIKEDEEEIKKMYPVTLSRPAFEINIGGYTLLSLIKSYFPNDKIIIKTRDYLMDFVPTKYKEKIKEKTKNKDRLNELKIIEINALTVPSVENMKKIKKGLSNLEKIKFPHEIIILNKKHCKTNLEFMKKKFEKKGNIHVGKNVKISKYIEFDCSEGPIIINDSSKIGPFCFIKGPIYIGKNCKIIEQSSLKENVVINDNCKIGGEVEHSIFMSFSNKQHYGYIGNSFVGSWVNLGAGTSTSDLKNTYGLIKVKDGLGNDIRTNEQFLGSIIGDYSKSAINTSIYTGKLIGVNSVIYGTIKENIGSFINYDNNKEEFIFEKAIHTQERMFKRRKIKQEEKHIVLLKKIFDETKKERKNIKKNRK